MVSFYSILETRDVKSEFSGRRKKLAEETNKRQGFLLQEPPKCGAFWKKVAKMAKTVRAFLEGNHAFSWVIWPKN